MLQRALVHPLAMPVVISERPPSTNPYVECSLKNLQSNLGQIKSAFTCNSRSIIDTPFNVMRESKQSVNRQQCQKRRTKPAAVHCGGHCRFCVQAHVSPCSFYQNLWLINFTKTFYEAFPFPFPLPCLCGCGPSCKWKSTLRSWLRYGTASKFQLSEYTQFILCPINEQKKVCSYIVKNMYFHAVL